MKLTNKERHDRWRAANPGREAELQARWRAKNKDKIAKANSTYWSAYASDPDIKQKAVERAVAWQKANKERRAAIRAAYRARKRQASGSHTGQDIQDLHARQKGKCAACRTSIPTAYHVDHIVPLRRGGSNDKSNLQLLCASCNCSKGARDPIAFAQSRGLLL
jgi:5-methylcytosine-specific restriction endonuclease McrA